MKLPISLSAVKGAREYDLKNQINWLIRKSRKESRKNKFFK